MNKRDSLASGAKHLKAVVTRAAAKSGGERVVVDESGGEDGGDDVRGWVRVTGGGTVEVGAEVTEGESEVGVGVEVGEREDMVLVEGWCGGGHVGGLSDFDLHCREAIGCRLLSQGVRCFAARPGVGIYGCWLIRTVSRSLSHQSHRGGDVEHALTSGPQRRCPA